LPARSQAVEATAIGNLACGSVMLTVAPNRAR